MWAARSASAIAAALALGGCVSTQTLSARAQLQATRLLATRQAQLVRVSDPRVHVMSVAVLAGRGGSAIVVTLRNASQSPLTDLPISVGVEAGRRPSWLNDRPGLAYFDTHIAALGPGATADWVFTTTRRLAPGVHALALVGAPILSVPRRLPRILATSAPSGAVIVRNGSDIPQDDLPVYAVVRSGGRVVAAGRATVGHLTGNGSATVPLTLVGAARTAPVLDALPTIYD